MLNEKLSHEESINKELMIYDNLSATLIKLKRIPGIIFPGFIVHHTELRTIKKSPLAIVFFHGEISDEILHLLGLNAYVFPDEISDVIHTDYLEFTTSELCILKNRIHTNIPVILHDLLEK